MSNAEWDPRSGIKWKDYAEAYQHEAQKLKRENERLDKENRRLTKRIQEVEMVLWKL
jgi:predicted  nucleic acid-binding Zn-ribbon protein